jgi:hypothetical protein
MLRPEVLNLDPDPLEIESNLGIFIVKQIQNSTAEIAFKGIGSILFLKMA